MQNILNFFRLNNKHQKPQTFSKLNNQTRDNYKKEGWGGMYFAGKSLTYKKSEFLLCKSKNHVFFWGCGVQLLNVFVNAPVIRSPGPLQSWTGAHIFHTCRVVNRFWKRSLNNQNKQKTCFVFQSFSKKIVSFSEITIALKTTYSF